MNLFDTLEKHLVAGVDPEACAEDIWDRFGHTYAALVIDSSGFTRIVKEHGPLHYLSRLAQKRMLSLPILEKYQSKMHHFEGDNIHAYFEHVDQAVAAVIEIREAISHAGVTLGDGEPYRICAGIGYGELLYSETLEGCFGLEMNLASKLGEDTANADELLITTAAFEQCTSSCKEVMTPANIEVSGTDITYYQMNMRENCCS